MREPELPYFYFIPDYEFYDGVEMAPCRIVNDPGPEFNPNTSVERIENPCDYDKIAFWSVYLHMKTGGVECVADFKTETEANELYELLERQLEIFQAQSKVTT